MLINLRDEISFKSFSFLWLHYFTVEFTEFECLLYVELLELVKGFHDEVDAFTYADLIGFVLFYEPGQQFLKIGIYILYFILTMVDREMKKSFFS